MQNLIALTLITISLVSWHARAQEVKALNTIVNDLCDKKVVLLGEDAHHGSGTTMEIKTALITRLIDECKFSALLFESPVYEFLHYQEALKLNTASVQQVKASIGGLWSNATTMAPFIKYLHEKADNNQLALGGIDAQFGANQPFAQQQLPARLSKYLDNDAQQVCEETLYRHLNWQYSKELPYNDAVKAQIQSCTSQINDKLGTLNEPKNLTLQFDQFMAENFYRYMHFKRQDYFNLRDKAMADNVNWHLSQLPEHTKTIVWTTTIHAAKTLTPISSDQIPTGYYLAQKYQNDMASIGFSALAGSFGRSPDKTKAINAATLAQQVFHQNNRSLIYLDHNELKKQEEIGEQAIRYNSVEHIDWSRILDGLIILRSEKPIH